jgi:hypothetical protein
MKLILIMKLREAAAHQVRLLDRVNTQVLRKVVHTSRVWVVPDHLVLPHLHRRFLG